MDVRMYELTGKEACKKARAFRGHTEARPEFLEYIVVLNTTFRALMEGKIEPDREHVREHIAAQMIHQGIYTEKDDDVWEYYTSEPREEFLSVYEKYMDRKATPQFKVKVNDATEWLLRYKTSEKRPVQLYLPPVNIDAGHGLNVLTAPTMAIVDEIEKIIEVVAISFTTPKLVQKYLTHPETLGSVDNRAMYIKPYCLMLYARTMVPKNETWRVKGSIYYLRRKDDKAVIDEKGDHSKENELDFFAKKGGNIVTIEEDWDSSTPSFRTEHDIDFDPIIEEYVSGIEESECSEEDCKSCRNYPICKFEEAPLKLPILSEKEKGLSDIILSDVQADVVETEEGTVRVIAKAGSGKTTTICILVPVLLEKGVDPRKILVVTFTVKAAEEVKERITRYNNDFESGQDVKGVTIKTFDGLFSEIMEREYARFGYTANPAVTNNITRGRMIRNLVNRNPVRGLDYRNFTMNTRYVKGGYYVAAKAFDIIKKERLGPGDEDTLVLKMYRNARTSIRLETAEDLMKLYFIYEDEMKKENLIEYPDLINSVFEILHKDPYYFEDKGYEYVIIDEAQDTSPDQFQFAKTLYESPNWKMSVFVGDDGQAIYGFRGCTPDNLVHLEDFFADVKDYRMTDNYRSREAIVNYGNTLDSLNISGLKAKMVAHKEGGKVTVQGFFGKAERLDYIRRTVEDCLKRGYDLEDIFYLDYKRTGLLSVADMFKKVGVPTVVMSNEPLKDNSRITALRALARFVRDEEDTLDLSIFTNARIGGGLMEHTRAEQDDLNIESINLMRDYLSADEAHRKTEFLKLAEVINYNDDDIYRSFLDSLAREHDMAGVFGYIDDFAVFGEAESAKREGRFAGLRLFTVHGSKGLESPVVILDLTNFDGKDMPRRGPELEEKRRLHYVGATRAIDELYVIGNYVAFGSKGNYTLNQHLMEAYQCAGEDFPHETVNAVLTAKSTRKK